MRRFFILFISIFLLYFLVVTPASAKSLEMGSFSIEIPEHWESSEEGHLTFITNGKEKTIFSVMELHYELPDPVRLFKYRYGSRELQKIDDSHGYLFESDSKTRNWATMAPNGVFIEIEVPEPSPELLKILQSFKLNSSAPKGTDVIIESLKNPLVSEWLTFKKPGKAENPDTAPNDIDEEIETKLYNGHGLVSEVPKDWVIKEEPDFVVFMSKDHSSVCKARVFPVNSSDEKSADETVKKIIKSLDGKNIILDEGFYEFDTPDDMHASINLGDNLGLLLLYTASENMALLNVLMSTRIAE